VKPVAFLGSLFYKYKNHIYKKYCALLQANCCRLMSAAEQKVIKVLIVEDSPTVAEFLRQVLDTDPRIRVIGTAFAGQLALEAVQPTKPDVIAWTFTCRS
jgi:PleD family two-component response regulator